jgi:predicted membrane channel-forming protein YqfA (hemolysin III family)
MLVKLYNHQFVTEINENPELVYLTTFGGLSCMFASSMYHLYRDIGPNESQMFLKFDLIGIVLMIFVFAFVAVWLAFSPHPKERFYIFGILLGIFCTNLLLSVTPCYTD